MSTKPIRTRVIKTSNFQDFRSKLMDTDWNSIINAPSPDESYDQLQEYITPTYNQCFPVKETNPKSRNHSKPWFTPGLLISCRRKNYLYKQAKITPTPDTKQSILNTVINITI